MASLIGPPLPSILSSRARQESALASDLSVEDPRVTSVARAHPTKAPIFLRDSKNRPMPGFIDADILRVPAPPGPRRTYEGLLGFESLELKLGTGGRSTSTFFGGLTLQLKFVIPSPPRHPLRKARSLDTGAGSSFLASTVGSSSTRTPRSSDTEAYLRPIASLTSAQEGASNAHLVPLPDDASECSSPLPLRIHLWRISGMLARNANPFQVSAPLLLTSTIPLPPLMLSSVRLHPR